MSTIFVHSGQSSTPENGVRHPCSTGTVWCSVDVSALSSPPKWFRNRINENERDAGLVRTLAPGADEVQFDKTAARVFHCKDPFRGSGALRLAPEERYNPTSRCSTQFEPLFPFLRTGRKPRSLSPRGAPKSGWTSSVKSESVLGPGLVRENAPSETGVDTSGESAVSFV